MSITKENFLESLEDFFLTGQQVIGIAKTINFSNPDSKQVAMIFNPERDGFIIENDSQGKLYLLAEDTRATPTHKTVTILPGETYESESAFRRYNGVVTYFGEDTTGTATVTEFTRIQNG